MAMARVVEPEWLDVLPSDDLRSMKSRRDLALLNRIMMQASTMERLLGLMPTSRPVRLLEIGSGDGSFMLTVARRLAPKIPSAQVFLLDMQNVVTDSTLRSFADLGWRAERVEADVFDYLHSSRESFDAISANLFLHHFEPAPLAELFALAATRTPLFAACEPRRDALSLAASHMVWALGCNDVTRHDAVVSVRAGFSGRDLSALWPMIDDWRLQERRAGLFTHAFVAVKSAEARL
ncbi:MAG: class SAM-dependent methyltransferase [Hyphomicrobiales bacterium]|nr:class SAM-dependent methyltransferase [Hyphomicrobiales bacterium]